MERSIPPAGSMFLQLAVIYTLTGNTALIAPTAHKAMESLIEELYRESTV
jgi:hypothetical protein